MRIPGADGPAHIVANRHLRATQPDDDDVQQSLATTTDDNPISNDGGGIDPDQQPPPAKRAKIKRMPRSELRAFYRSLTAAELEERVRMVIEQLREVVMEYLYSTY